MKEILRQKRYYAERVEQVNEDTIVKYIKDESHMKEFNDMNILDSTISRIMDRVLPVVKEWQEHLLEEIYVVIFMDTIYYHVRSEGCITP